MLLGIGDQICLPLRCHLRRIGSQKNLNLLHQISAWFPVSCHVRTSFLLISFHQTIGQGTGLLVVVTKKTMNTLVTHENHQKITSHHPQDDPRTGGSHPTSSRKALQFRLLMDPSDARMSRATTSSGSCFQALDVKS